MTRVRRLSNYKLVTAISVMAGILDCEDLSPSDRDAMQTAYDRLIEMRRNAQGHEPAMTPHSERHYHN